MYCLNVSEPELQLVTFYVALMTQLRRALQQLHARLLALGDDAPVSFFATSFLDGFAIEFHCAETSATTGAATSCDQSNILQHHRSYDAALKLLLLILRSALCLRKQWFASSTDHFHVTQKRPGATPSGAPGCCYKSLLKSSGFCNTDPRPACMHPIKGGCAQQARLQLRQHAHKLNHHPITRVCCQGCCIQLHASAQENVLPASQGVDSVLLHLSWTQTNSTHPLLPTAADSCRASQSAGAALRHSTN